jgi:hypothetical protein
MPRDEFDEMLVRMWEEVLSYTPEEWERQFKAMGGERVETPFGTLLLIRPFLLREGSSDVGVPTLRGEN